MSIYFSINLKVFIYNKTTFLSIQIVKLKHLSYNGIMIVQIYSKLKENLLIKAIRNCLDSKWMMIALIALTAISNIFGAEIFVYYCYTIIIVLATLFCDDLLSLFPIPCCGYMTFSKSNNPLSKEQSSIFLKQSSITHMIIIGITISIFVITRIIFDIIKHKERRTRPKLLFGFIILGLTYILGGLFTNSYSTKTALFGLIQILTLSFTYFCFYFTVDWRRVNKNYFPILFTLIGFLMVTEVFNMLLISNFFNTTGSFNRGNLYTGWGIYNNVAGICIFTIPAPFYFACTKKNGWIYSLLGTLFLVFTILTQSRNGILMGTITYGICALFTLIKTKKTERIKHLITFFALLITAITILFMFKETIINLFFGVYKAGTNDSGRFNIYKHGLEQYIESPILGKGFYECEAFRWGIPYKEGSFLPPRYHNTYVQILASCGTIGIIAYLFHRFETIKLFYKSKDTANQLIGITLIGFILIGLLDCHFHNFGPGFLYSALLLLSEKIYNNNETKKAISK